MNKNLKIASGLVLGLMLAVPSVSLAHDNKNDDSGRNRIRLESKSDFKINGHEWNENRDGGIRTFDNFSTGLLQKFQYRGMVTAVSSTGFTLQTSDNKTYTVNTANSQIIRIPNTTIALTNINVNDKVMVFGTLSGTTLTASTVFDLEANKQVAAGKGAVTAVNGNNVTVQTKNNQTVTLQTDANTTITKADGSTATVADVNTGAKVKFFGLLDKVTNAFTALWVKIK